VIEPVSVSQIVRVTLESRFGALFNDALVAAFNAFGTGAYAFMINFDQADGSEQNFYREDRSLDSAIQFDLPELPALAMWVGDGQNQSTEMPRLFSGQVVVHWRFFLFVAGNQKTGLAEQREACESALLAVLDPEFSGIGYRGDLGWSGLTEKAPVGQDDQHFGWGQAITYSATFEVNV
jgi:hypothetical protein